MSKFHPKSIEILEKKMSSYVIFIPNHPHNLLLPLESHPTFGDVMVVESDTGSWKIGKDKGKHTVWDTQLPIGSMYGIFPYTKNYHKIQQNAGTVIMVQ